jgi:hypothetical protein
MNKTEAIAKLQELDNLYTAKSEELDYWGKEYRLAGSSSKYVKASSKPMILVAITSLKNERQAIWHKIEAIMDEFGIDAHSII